MNKQTQKSGQPAAEMSQEDLAQSVNPEPKSSVEIDHLRAQVDELTADLQRTRADFENFRKQVEIQKQQYANIAKSTTLNKILPIFDDLDRAIAAHPEQLGPIAKNLEKAISSVGLQRISADPGSDFNPDLHEAVAAEGDGDVEVIAEVLRPGYLYDGEVLRPAMVKVLKQA